MKRRRFLQLSATAPTVLATSCEKLREAKNNKPQSFTWNGVIFGNRSTITFQQISKSQAELLIPSLRQEIARLEHLFSLQHSSSLITLLNSRRKVLATAFEFKELLTIALDFSNRTEGLFDPTIQSYKQTLENSYAQGEPLTPRQRTEALGLVDYQNVITNGLETTFAHPGMALTLNGIAQGYITDKIHSQLTKLGFTNILINLGEYRALGAMEGAKPWKIHLKKASYGELGETILELPDGALAISSGQTYRFSDTGKDHHLINPLTGECLEASRTIAVKAPDATTADALSTACAVTSPEKAAAIVERFPGASIVHDSMVA